MTSIRYVIFGRTDDPDAFGALGDRMLEFVEENEPGTSVYNWYVSEDGQTMNEDGFESTDALAAHLGNATESGMLDEFMALIDITGVHVFGDVDDAAREILANFGAVHFSETHSL